VRERGENEMEGSQKALRGRTGATDTTGKEKTDGKNEEVSAQLERGKKMGQGTK